MGTVTRPNTFVAGTVIKSSEVNDDLNTIYNEFNGNINNANIKAAAGIVDSKLATITTTGKVNTSALTTTTDYTGTGTWILEGLTMTEQTSSLATAADQGALYQLLQRGVTELFYRPESSGTAVKLTNGGIVNGAAVVQSTYTLSADSLSTSVTIPSDDTIPQSTEGTQVLSVAVTPSDATNKLRIDVVMNCSHPTASAQHIGALFQDAGANAIGVGWNSQAESANAGCQVCFTHWMTAGTAASTTFKVRGGSDGAGQWAFNGVSTARRFGGVMASSITITEYSN